MVPIRDTFYYDVVVCGGGTAGFCAAIAAARNGARVCVVERFGMLGGTMTVGGITSPAFFHAYKKQIIGGIAWEFVTALANMGYAALPNEPMESYADRVSQINAFAAAVLMDRMMKKEKVDVFYLQSLADAKTEWADKEKLLGDKAIKEIYVTSTKGLVKIEGKVFIDATGDATLGSMAGAETELADELQPGSLSVIFDALDFSQISEEELEESYRRAMQEGRIRHGDIWGGEASPRALMRGRTNKSVVSSRANVGIGINHVFPCNGADDKSRAEAEMEGRESVFRILEWLRSDIRGCENAHVAASAPFVTARESLRIIGNAYITAEDYLKGREYEDGICYCYYDIDIHLGNANHSLHVEKIEDGRIPQIPFGALAAKGFSNLLMCGRIISGDRKAAAAYRVEVPCMAMGEAVGTAAAIMSRNVQSVSELELGELKHALTVQGAIVPK